MNADDLTEADLSPLLARIDELWGAALGTPEGDELDRLVDLVVAVEDRLYPWGDEDETCTSASSSRANDRAGQTDLSASELPKLR